MDFWGNTWIGGDLAYLNNINNHGRLRVGGNYLGSGWPGLSSTSPNGSAWINGTGRQKDNIGIPPNDFIKGNTTIVGDNNRKIGSGASDFPKPKNPPNLTKVESDGKRTLNIPSDVTPIDWNNAWITGSQDQAIAKFQAAIDGAPAASKHNGHTVIKITSAVSMSTLSGKTLNRKVIFMLEGDNASLRGTLPANNPPNSMLIYVGAGGAKLGTGSEGDSRLILSSGFNGLIYTDEQNTANHYLDFAQVPGDVRGAIIAKGTGQIDMKGNSGAFTYNEEILNNYADFVVSEDESTATGNITVKDGETIRLRMLGIYYH